MCNVIHEGVSKCLTNMWKKVVPSLSGPNQNAFTSGRVIGDSCLHVHELFNILKSKWQAISLTTPEVDLNKASNSWGETFWGCVTTRWVPGDLDLTRYEEHYHWFSHSSGIPNSPFWSSMGIRQGDLLLCFIFILCMQVLSNHLLQAQEPGGGGASKLEFHRKCTYQSLVVRRVGIQK